MSTVRQGGQESQIAAFFQLSSRQDEFRKEHMVQHFIPSLVSILSPVFNEAKHIVDMMESVLNQTHHEFELIFVDDGSTDNTEQLIREYSARDSRIKLISEGKLGKVAAFNRAYNESRGAVIVLSAGDDLLPPNSLELRIKAVRSAWGRPDTKVAAFARLKTFSDNPRFSGQVIPRSPSRGSRSGGALALSRTLADLLFPIPETLVSEDLWLGNGAEAAAEAIVELPDIVLAYRIHEGNSNPRNQPFDSLNESIHSRMKAFSLLAAQDRFELPEAKREHFQALWDLERLRFDRDSLAILTKQGAPFVARLRALSMSHPKIHGIRTHFFKLLSGW